MENITETRFFTSKEKKQFIANIIIFFLLLLVVTALVVFPKLKDNTTNLVEFSSVDKICELATLRCYYHNVAEYEKQPDGFFRYGLFQYGYKKLWMEYNGIVEVGIDVSKVQVNPPDINGVVEIYVPEAQIVGISSDENSINTITDTGVLTSITTKEKSDAFSKAQADMRESAQNDHSILLQAHNNAKSLLRQYIINVGEQLGQQYTVRWLSSPK